MNNAPPIVEMIPVVSAKKDGKAVLWAEQADYNPVYRTLLRGVSAQPC